MIKYVHLYLTKYYRLELIRFNGEPAICKIIEGETATTATYPNRLIKELITVFSVDEETIRLWICEWANDIKFNVDLSEWWERKEFLAQTVGSEIVSVQPMAGPTNTLFYMDYVVGTDSAVEDNEITIIKYLRKLIKNKFGKVK